MNQIAKKSENHYETLVNAFLTDSKLQDVDPMEKKKFMAICAVNKLNPFKWEIYAIPRKKKDGERWIKVLTPVINYNMFIRRAEESWKLSWWNIFMKKENWQIESWKITIYRKDWGHPFEYEAEVKDFMNYTKDQNWNTKLENPLWDTKREATYSYLIFVMFSRMFCS